MNETCLTIYDYITLPFTFINLLIAVPVTFISLVGINMIKEYNLQKIQRKKKVI
mgnify:CR=1 FL=1